MIRNQFGRTIQQVHNDNGMEFTNGPLHEFFRKHRILFETSCVDTPQQNGRVEHKNRHILNVARTLRFQSSLPLPFWGHYVLSAAYLINRTPTKLLDGKTPSEVLHEVQPNYDHIKVFECLCYATTMNPIEINLMLM